MNENAVAGENREVTLHFIKSAQFRVIHCDGAVGSPSPDGSYIHMALFSERLPIPMQSVHEVAPDGRVIRELSRSGRDGVVREVEVDVIMDIACAETISLWLTAQLDRLKALHQQNDPGTQ